MTPPRVRFFAILAFLGVVSCSEAADPFAEVKAAVARDLKDPGSAQFRDLRSVGELTCGEVNAKNSYGGYVGFRPFLVWEGGVRIAPSGEAVEEALEQARIQTACVDGDTSRLGLQTYHSMD